MIIFIIFCLYLIILIFVIINFSRVRRNEQFSPNKNKKYLNNIANKIIKENLITQYTTDIISSIKYQDEVKMRRIMQEFRVYTKLVIYPLIFIFVWFLPSVNRIIQMSASNQKNFYLQLLGAFTVASSGFLNLIAYFFNPFVHYRILTFIFCFPCCLVCYKIKKNNQKANEKNSYQQEIENDDNTKEIEIDDINKKNKFSLDDEFSEIKNLNQSQNEINLNQSQNEIKLNQNELNKSQNELNLNKNELNPNLINKPELKNNYENLLNNVENFNQENSTSIN